MLGYERGSEWRRWDLHIHTPGTQKNDQYEGTNLDEKWDRFYQRIADYIGDGLDPMKNIAVIGITDYLSIDNCKKVICDDKLLESIRLVLPNVELRMTPLARETPINIHCIFAPELINELETRFFAKLFFEYGGRRYSASYDDLRRLGRAFSGESLSDDKAYSAGLNQFVVTPQAIEEIFKNDTELREKTIIVVSNKSADGVSGITQHKGYTTENGCSQMDATRRNVYQMADLIFSSSKSDINYFLGEASDTPDDIMKRYGSLKGCIHGSDAHSNAKVFELDQHRYCWIKSDPTFNGLKQIIYEPKARIRISQVKPEEKPAYQVIDSVVFSNPDFSPEPIFFNDKLTCIIGGKSTGKSLLLHNMARAIDDSQVKEKMDVTKGGNRTVEEIQVKWADGTISCPGSSTADDHKIVYIPQTYLNRLTDKNEEVTEIDNIIHGIIMINAEAAVAYQSMMKDLGSYKLQLDKKIYDCMQKYNDFQSKKSTLKDLGTSSGIEEEIARLKKKKEELSKNTSISEREIAQYDTAIVKITRLDALNGTIDQEVKLLTGMEDIFTEPDVPTDLSEETSATVRSVINTIRNQANSIWKKEKTKIVGTLEEMRIKNENERSQSKEIADKLAPKIADNDAMKEISEKIAKEEANQLRYKEIEKQMNQAQQLYNQSVDSIVKSIAVLRELEKNMQLKSITITQFPEMA